MGLHAMSNPDLAMIQYLELAKFSQARRQLAGRDRFLILAGVAACRAGFLDVAETCRERVLKHNPRHLLGQWATLPEALRSEDFPALYHQLERFCSVEKAESLLSGLNASVKLEDSVSARDFAWKQLADECWKDESPALTGEQEATANGKTD
jgi:hypothetical protein